MELGVKSTRNAVYQTAYHAVWIPKYRKKILAGDVADRLRGVLHEIAQAKGFEVLTLEIQPDHSTGPSQRPECGRDCSILLQAPHFSGVVDLESSVAEYNFTGAGWQEARRHGTCAEPRPIHPATSPPGSPQK